MRSTLNTYELNELINLVAKAPNTSSLTMAVSEKRSMPLGAQLKCSAPMQALPALADRPASRVRR